MKKYILLLVPFVFFSCASTGGIEDFYHSNFSENDNPPEECFLQENEEPKVYYSSDLSSDINFLKSNYYQILGYSTFNGPANDDLSDNIKNMCKQERAQIGLYNYEYTDTRYGTYTLYGGGVSSYNIKRYDYTIVLFISLPSWYIRNQKSGFEVKDLDSNTRPALQRNTGAVIDVVYNKSNAFYANVIQNDVLIEINGVPIFSAADYYSFIKDYSGTQFSLKLIRNGQKITINY